MRLPAFWSAVFLIAGIWIGHEAVISDFIVFLAAVLFFTVGLIIYLKKIRRLSWLVMGAAILICGIFRVSLDYGNLSNNDISHFNDLGERVRIAGEIVREPDLRPSKTYLTLRADTIYINKTSIPVSGRVMIKLDYFSSHYNYADYILVDGFLSTPLSARNPGGFDYRKYLLVKNIRSFMSVKRNFGIHKVGSQSGTILLTKIVIPLRQKILSVYDRYLSSPQKSLIAGFVIGETRFIPPEIFQQFRDTGTLHLLAVSGSNVALVIGTVVFFLLVLRVPIRYRHLISIAVIILFSNLSYNQPSVIRASVMIGLYLLGRLAFRRVNYVNIISLSAFFILMFNPLMLWDVGFQLSFCATFGLIYFLPIIYNRLSFRKSWARKIPGYLLMTFLSSIVAQLAVAPVLAYHFNTIPLIGFLSNLIIVPLSSLAVIMSLILLMFSWLPPIAGIIGMITNLLLSGTIAAVSFFNSMPVVKLNIASPDWIMVILYYIMILQAFGIIRKLSTIRYLLITILVFLNILVWRTNIGRLDDSTVMTVFDVGKHALIDMKSSGEVFCVWGMISEESQNDPIENVYIPYCKKSGIRKIGRVIPLDSEFKNRVDSILIKSGLELNHNAVHASDKNNLSGNIPTDHIRLLKSDLSDQFAALVYQRADVKMMVINDISRLAACSENIPEYFISLDILLLPEPGRITNTLRDMILDINPRNLIFYSYQYRYLPPVGYDNLSEVLKSNGIDLFSTREQGGITIKISSSRLEIFSAMAYD